MIKAVAQKILSKKILSPLKGRRFILAYHDISTSKDAHHAPLFYSTRPNVLKSQLQFMSGSGQCNFVTLNEILLNDNLPKDKIHVALTFDDGFESVRTQALPILQYYKTPFSIFLNREAIEHDQLWVSNLFIHRNDLGYLRKVYDVFLTGKLEFREFVSDPVSHVVDFNFTEENADFLRLSEHRNEKTYMDLKSVAEFVKQGVQVGNHSARHLVLSSCDDELCRQEIQENKDFLEGNLGIDIKHFALPFGKKEHYNEQTIRIAEETGHSHVLSSNVNAYDHESSDDLVPRIAMTNESTNQLIWYFNRTLFKRYAI